MGGGSTGLVGGTICTRLNCGDIQAGGAQKGRHWLVGVGPPGEAETQKRGQI